MHSLLAILHTDKSDEPVYICLGKKTEIFASSLAVSGMPL